VRLQEVQQPGQKKLAVLGAPLAQRDARRLWAKLPIYIVARREIAHPYVHQHRLAGQMVGADIAHDRPPVRVVAAGVHRRQGDDHDQRHQEGARQARQVGQAVPGQHGQGRSQQDEVAHGEELPPLVDGHDQPGDQDDRQGQVQHRP